MVSALKPLIKQIKERIPSAVLRQLFYAHTWFLVSNSCSENHIYLIQAILKGAML